MLLKNWKHQSSKDLIIISRHSNNRIGREHTIRFGKYALFILYTFIMGVACGLTFRQQMNIISISGELPGFIVRLTSFTSKHTSLECQIAVNESEKVVFKPIQTALMPVRTTYFRKWENRNKNPHHETPGLNVSLKWACDHLTGPFSGRMRVPAVFGCCLKTMGQCPRANLSLTSGNDTYIIRLIVKSSWTLE